MPRKATVEKAKKDLKQGKSPSTAAGEFVREEIEHVRQGKHGARSPKQAIAIGLSEARRAGVPLKPPKKGTTSDKTRRSAERAYKKGQSHPAAGESGSRRSRATEAALKREPKNTASRQALSKQAKSAAARRRKRAA
jgi:hypothetical protein